jgi:uncharacterized protein (TIGR03085 family)
MADLCEDPLVKAIDVARAERQELCDLLIDVGPDAPTLCAGWMTRDLAAHLVVRESRPDAALGILIGPLAGYAESVQAKVARRPWTELVRDVRDGPPLLSPFRLPGAQSIADPFEFTVHHEDVRRAQPGWRPRILTPGEQDLLWERLARGGRLLARSSPVGVVLLRSDTGERVRVKGGPGVVTVVGEPLEMLLRLYGRRESIVDLEGAVDGVTAFESARFGV